MSTLTILTRLLDHPLSNTDWLTAFANSCSENRHTALTAAASLCGYTAIDDSDGWPLRPDFSTVAYTEQARRALIIGHDRCNRLCIAVATPLDPDQGAFLSRLDRAFADIYLADPLIVRAELDKHEANYSAVADAVGPDEAVTLDRNASPDLSLTSIQGEASPAVRLISSTVFDALRFEASDIHLETVAHGLEVKFRIDGALNHIATLSNPSLAEEAIARVKVLAELDIAEKRIPQDGRFRVALKGRDIDIRVSVIPGFYGEDAVLRILDKQALMDQVQKLSLDSLGFDQHTVRMMRRMAAEPYGMMLVTGPTGSGKTTTLYAALTEINQGEDKFITIEDPVEYQLPGVLQIPVNEKKGLTFAVGLRSILRHDPDKILVGEIRDPETAQIAVQSALTGHLVLTSVHANNAFDVIGRFMHMGIDPYNFVSALTGVVAQRLIRLNCPHCVCDTLIDTALLEESGIQDIADYRFKAGSGCKQCRGTGYKGRQAVAEVLRITDEVRELIVSRAPIRALKECARQDGMRGLRDIVLDMVRQGVTTLQEANRVTFVA